MQKDSTVWETISWTFAIVFLVTGVLNVIFVHPVPGVFYIVLTLFYIPRANTFLKKRSGFSIPPIVKIITGFFVLWATLAVGDLMEMFESWLGV